MKKISIIVPAYNCEKYIAKCINSLTSQSYSDLEIIVVNNNSRDETPNIVKKLAKEDKRIKLYDCKKQGVSSARNYGIRKATGDYISFVDSDDYCHLEMYQALVDKTESSNLDIVICGIKKINQNGETLPKENEKSAYHGQNIVKKYLCLPAAPFAKIIKTELIKKHNLKFREDISLAEDLVFASELAAYTSKIAFLEEEYYIYCQHEGSITHAANPTFEYQIFEALGYIYGFYDKKVKLLQKYHDEIERMFIANLVLGASTRYMIPENDKQFYEQARSFLRSHFPKWHKNKYYQSRGIKVKLFFLCYRCGCALALRKLISRNNA